MSKFEIATIGLLSLSLWGCVEATDDGQKSSRTGALGVTTQDIDDLAKPAAATPAKPKPPAGLYDEK
jgi:hypothetical protein